MVTKQTYGAPLVCPAASEGLLYRNCQDHQSLRHPFLKVGEKEFCVGGRWGGQEATHKGQHLLANRVCVLWCRGWPGGGVGVPSGAKTLP
jgi:hypothetical protein